MTPSEYLGLLDDVIAVAERQGRKRNELVLDLVGPPTVVGQTGLPDDNEPGRYWFTLKQCRRMRRAILKAARADARGMA